MRQLNKSPPIWRKLKPNPVGTAPRHSAERQMRRRSFLGPFEDGSEGQIAESVTGFIGLEAVLGISRKQSFDVQAKPTPSN